MIKHVLKSLIYSIVLFLITCSGSVTEMENNDSFIYQIPGCQNQSLARTTMEDSCFTYEFKDKLIIDFCVVANCCPDTDRFSISSFVNDDTITVTVVDTAANLCDCVCEYIIHSEFDELFSNEIFFICYFNNEILYQKSLIRSNCTNNVVH